MADCHDPATGQSTSTDGISFVTSGEGAGAGVYQDCGSGGYIFAALDGSHSHGPSDLAAWEFSAPPGTTIYGAQIFRSFYAGASEPLAAPTDQIEIVTTSGTAIPVSQCSGLTGCEFTGVTNDDFADANQFSLNDLIAVSSIEGTAVCSGGSSCAPGGANSCPELGDPCIASNHLYAMVVTLDDPTAPTVSDVSGTLVQAGVISGVAGISFDATDTGSGLYSASIVVDGTPAAELSFGSSDWSCVPTADVGSPSTVLRFASTVPCPLAWSGGLQLDTSKLLDGTHTVAVTTTDAAGNTATVWNGTIRTDNAPQGASPQISGEAAVGRTLIAAAGGWSPTPTRYSYQWERCDATGSACAPIAGATGAGYTLTDADEYGRLTAIVTASDFSGSTSIATPPSAIVLDANGYASMPPAPTLEDGSVPQIVGTAREGDSLSAEPGVWSDGPLVYAYQWQRCDVLGLACMPIGGALRSSYTLTRADDYSRVRVVVSASGPGGIGEAASAVSTLIADAAGATSAPAAVSPGGSAAPVAAGGATGARSSAGSAHVANGSGACSGARLKATVNGASSVTIPLGRSVMLRGTLRCGTTPIQEALLDVEIAPVAGYASARQVRIRTSADGSFSYLVGSGYSRRFDLTYRAFSDDSEPSAQVSATVLVVPAISLAITPTQTTNGGTITFSGRVSGGEEPRNGLPLDVEYLEGSRWMVYDVVRASPQSGAFTYRYTFRRTTQSITYSFRIAIPAGGVSGYPYQPSASPPRAVHVNP